MRRLVYVLAVLAVWSTACGGGRQRQATEAELVVHVPCVREPCAGGEPEEEPAPPPLTGRPAITMLALGHAHSCALTEDGAVYCWGDNAAGQLGDIGHEESAIPAEVPSLPPMAAIWAGWNATCGRTRDDDAQLWCWGETGLGEGRPRQGFAMALPFEGVRAVSLFDRKGCFITGEGHLYCWGRYGVPHGPNWDSPQRVPVDGPTSVDIGVLRACAVASNGAPRCWGQQPPYLHTQRVDDGLWTFPDLRRDVAMVLFDEAIQGNPLVVDRSGRVLATERGRTVGHGATAHVETRALPGLEGGVVEVAEGGLHHCARRSDGTAACWGSNRDGQIGDGTEAERRDEPRSVPLTGLLEIAAGGRHTCARTAERLFCWGGNANGQLGVEGVRAANQPLEVPW